MIFRYNPSQQHSLYTTIAALLILHLTSMRPTLCLLLSLFPPATHHLLSPHDLNACYSPCAWPVRRPPHVGHRGIASPVGGAGRPPSRASRGRRWPGYSSCDGRLSSLLLRDEDAVARGEGIWPVLQAAAVVESVTGGGGGEHGKRQWWAARQPQQAQ